jgi:hypothetical protein
MEKSQSNNSRNLADLKEAQLKSRTGLEFKVELAKNTANN